MKNAESHKPWGNPAPETPRRSFRDWGARLPGIIRGAMAFLARHFRRIANWWSDRLRFLWRGPGAGARLAAIGLFLAGMAALVILSWLLLYLIPLLILAAFIAFILSALAVNRGDPRMR